MEVVLLKILRPVCWMPSMRKSKTKCFTLALCFLLNFRWQPDVYQGRGGFVKLGYLNKHNKNTIKKLRRKKCWSFFPKYSQNTFWMENLIQRWINSGPVFKIRTLCSIFKKWQGRPAPLAPLPPPHSPSCAPELPAICLEIIFILRFLYLANLTH